MAAVALHVPGTSTVPPSLRILVVIVLMAAAYFIYREYRGYLNRRSTRRNWK
ncbi:MAG: hypothetical protein WBH47_23555 [Streptosporangiaceae bacterium]